MARVLVVDDKAIMRESLHETLCRVGHEAECCASGPDAIGAFQKEEFEAVITDLKMPGMTGIDLMKEIRRIRRDVPVIVMTAFGAVGSAVEAMKCGAFDYVEKPFKANEIAEIVQRAVAERGNGGGSGQGGSRSKARIVGDSQVMRGLKEKIGRLAKRGSLVLIVGETGTGKELVARALHCEGPRRDRPFVCVNCPGLSAGLLESELFGHEKGAFTGADRARKGRFELAGEGSILLDEVSEIDLGLQAKLLRVLQERTYERVGSSQILTTNARVIATTNRDLEEEVRRHRFRSDLYFRLNVVPVMVPPLRERKEDIPGLAEEFVRRHASEERTFSEEAIEKLVGHDWPGNVRELENIVERACAENEERVVRPKHLVIRPVRASRGTSGGIRSIRDMEKSAIESALEYFGGHQERAAESLGITSRTLRNKIKRYEIRR
jgi:DNA-binding NtrC family response regulator